MGCSSTRIGYTFFFFFNHDKTLRLCVTGEEDHSQMPCSSQHVNGMSCPHDFHYLGLNNAPVGAFVNFSAVESLSSPLPGRT